MQKRVYINFSDLKEEIQQEILNIAKDNVLESEREEIIEEYGESRLDEIASEKAERELYNLDFVFNV